LKVSIVAVEENIFFLIEDWLNVFPLARELINVYVRQCLSRWVPLNPEVLLKVLLIFIGFRENPQIGTILSI